MKEKVFLICLFLFIALVALSTGKAAWQEPLQLSGSITTGSWSGSWSEEPEGDELFDVYEPGLIAPATELQDDNGEQNEPLVNGNAGHGPDSTENTHPGAEDILEGGEEAGIVASGEDENGKEGTDPKEGTHAKEQITGSTENADSGSTGLAGKNEVNDSNKAPESGARETENDSAADPAGKTDTGAAATGEATAPAADQGEAVSAAANGDQSQY